MDSIPSTGDPMFGFPKLPSQFENIKPHQWEAVGEILTAFGSMGDNDIVFLDAPTGTGKTLVGELVRRLMKVRGLYVCTTKSLQQQFTSEFPYAKLLKGRSNYPTVNGAWPVITCADCTWKSGCNFCPSKDVCPYEKAKKSAMSAEVAVLNTSYLVTEANYVGRFANQELVVVDECDKLEDVLVDFIEYRIPKWVQVDVPRKGTHKTTVIKWMDEELMPWLNDRLVKLEGCQLTLDEEKLKSKIEELIWRTGVVKGELEANPENWIRDNAWETLVLKPVTVSGFGNNYLWRHSKKWLLMSASIGSADMEAEILGVNEAGLNWEVVSVPMMYSKENRRINIAPVAEVTEKTKEESWPRLATAISHLLRDNPDRRVLVHSVSYKLTSYLCDWIRPGDRTVFTYSRPDERDSVLAKFRATEGAVLVAPSFERGVDLKGDDCRVIIIPKVPFPNIGDARTSQRVNGTRSGQRWYALQAIRSLVQMTGRGVRDESDYCETYILDSSFGRLKREHRGLMPIWWYEALNTNYNAKELLR